jgi:single-stranded-DNA-specific exonuclease
VPPLASNARSSSLVRQWRSRAGGATPSGTLIERILAARGLTDHAEIARFQNPSLKDLHDPSLIPDVDRAATRILQAIENKEAIAIYGDYDVDGVTATAILFHTLRTIAPDADVRTYVPHRLEEGYGLNAAAVRTLAEQGARVIISVDCGITAHEPARAARLAGADLIITDHHNPPASLEELPGAYAVVHPRRPDAAYPFGDLSGAGVAYKLAWRLSTMHSGGPRVSAPLRALLIDLLAMAALGAIADVMPLTGENRVIARYGLARVKDSSIAGLRALVAASGLGGERVTPEDAGFRLAPRLNACGRLGHAREAVELFTTASGDRADEIARSLTTINNERRAIEQKIARHAIELAESRGMGDPDRRAIVLAHEDWHPGVLGIVCSRLVERFHRPTILMQRLGDACHGSGRSVAGYSLHAGLVACAPLLSQFGGHDMAAGVKLAADRLDEFAAALDAHARDHLAPEHLSPSLAFDAEASLRELTPEAVEEIESLAPFGVGNPRPRVLLRRVTLDARPRTLGESGKHVAIVVRQGDRPMRLIAWNWAERACALPSGVTLDAIVSPKLSHWNGRTSVEPELDDLRIVS